MSASRRPTDPAAPDPALFATLDAPGAPIHALVLDDEGFDRHRIARLCAGLPMPVTLHQADSLRSFDSALAAHVYDLIFVDYELPDGSGLTVLGRIRRCPRNRNAASIMITGRGDTQVALDAMREGCADFITKDDLSRAAFQRAVTNALQKSALSARVAAQTFARAEVEAVLGKFASQCANDIKPMVSRMMRQLRAMRDDAAATSHLNSTQRDTVETTCLHLWEFLDDLEKHSAEALLTGMSPLPQDPAAAGALSALAPVGQKRPPSPFRPRP